MIKWETVSDGDIKKIHVIVKRALEICSEYTVMDLEMDITAAHIYSPLNLDKLIGFDDGSFGHDVFGISRYINRDTGELTDCFLPRCARPSEATK